MLENCAVMMHTFPDAFQAYDDGREQLNENKAASADTHVIVERAQQPAQQQ